MIYHWVTGILLLFFGRRLFWLFVGLAGFLLGTTFAAQFLAGHGTWLALLIGLGAGCLGALLAIVAQRLAFALGGFYAAGYLVLLAFTRLGGQGAHPWLFLTGGLIGAFLAAVLMDWAVIILSALAGAATLALALHIQPALQMGAFLALSLAGVAVQARDLKTKATARPKKG